jgi:hypothetical protein
VNSEIIQQIRQHFDTVITHGTASRVATNPNPMWLASLDVRTGECPTQPSTIARVHGYIHAPQGVTLYWDQPHLVAAHALSHVLGDTTYANAADAYVNAFLQRSISNCDLFLWGNHYYYDVASGETFWFNTNTRPRPAGAHTVTAYLHEIRPIPPAWGLFWRVNPLATRDCIYAIGQYHLYDLETGGFNRHADQQPGFDYIEVGGFLIESLSWLYTYTRESRLVRLARQIASFTFDSRSPATDLLKTASMSKRWEHYTCTTEIGLWAGSLLRAANYTQQSQFRSMARDVVSAYLDYGWDQTTGQYFGRLNVNDGTPQRDLPGMDKLTVYQPDTYADIWNARFPSHDYPLALAETCAALYEQTHLPDLRTAIYRWANIIAERTYDNAPDVRYAEQFGRAIHFLLRASQVLDEQRFRIQAADVADIAVSSLFSGRMFRGHSGEDRYDAVDGVGYLLLALLYLETRKQPDYMGFGF